MKCQFCGGTAVYMDSSASVYGGRDYGPIWLCQCGARCGCHKGTQRPVGTLADDATRKARMQAHAAFDPLWKRGEMTRTEAYRWLSEKLGIEVEKCHIGMFSVEQCQMVLKAVNPEGCS